MGQDGRFLHQAALAYSRLTGNQSHLSLTRGCLCQQSSELVNFLAPANEGRRDRRLGTGERPNFSLNSPISFRQLNLAGEFSRFRHRVYADLIL
jgi:hypothetical protein